MEFPQSAQRHGRCTSPLNGKKQIPHSGMIRVLVGGREGERATDVEGTAAGGATTSARVDVVATAEGDCDTGNDAVDGGALLTGPSAAVG